MARLEQHCTPQAKSRSRDEQKLGQGETGRGKMWGQAKQKYIKGRERERGDER